MVLNPRFKYSVMCPSSITSATNDSGTWPGWYRIRPSGANGLRMTLMDSLPSVDALHGREVNSCPVKTGTWELMSG